MPKVTFEVEPQRSDGRAYVTCEPHKATSFAVIRREQSIRQGTQFTVSRVIGRYAVRTQAEAMADANRASYKPRPILKLGKRMPKRESQS